MRTVRIKPVRRGQRLGARYLNHSGDKIEQANNVSVGGHTSFSQSPIGLVVRGRRYKGTGTIAVHFTIDSFDDYTGIATCTPVTVPATGINPGTDSYGKIEVIDVDGCLFDEPAEELIGRAGHAHWLRILDEYGVPGDPQWVVAGLCCPPVEPLAE